MSRIGAQSPHKAGATVARLGAIFGPTGAKMAPLYTQSADRARLVRDAMKLLSGTGAEQPIVAPRSKARARDQKQQ